MPQGGPTRELLKRLGFTPPPETPPLTEEQQRLLDSRAYEQQAKDPLWKKLGRGLVDTVGGFAEGLVGAEPRSVKDAGISDYANLGGQILTSGLPFGAYKKMLPFGKVFHGTPKEFKIFDPSKYDKSDTLGWMTHYAENPDYAAQYAMGSMKHHPASDFLYGSTPKDFKPRTIPAEPEAKNVLDLVDPNPDDISAALAAVDPSQRENLIKTFKGVRRETSGTGQARPGDIGSHYFKTSHYPERQDLIENPATRAVAESLQLRPDQFDKTLFDAIRYNDVREKSWAIPSRTPVKTAWGTPLTDDPKPLDIFKTDRSGGGSLEVRPDRWANTPLSLPNEPLPELMKEDVTGNLWETYKKNKKTESDNISPVQDFDGWYDQNTGKKISEPKTSVEWDKNWNYEKQFAENAYTLKNTHYEIFDPVSGQTVGWAKTPEEVLEHIKLNPKLDYLGPGGQPEVIPGIEEMPDFWKNDVKKKEPNTDFPNLSKFLAGK